VSSMMSLTQHLCLFCRLRHEKLKPVRVDRGGPNEYQMLRCYPLEATPEPPPPETAIRREREMSVPVKYEREVQVPTIRIS